MEKLDFSSKEENPVPHFLLDHDARLSASDSDSKKSSSTRDLPKIVDLRRDRVTGWPLQTARYPPHNKAQLGQNYGGFFIVGIFAGLAILSWAMICLLTFRPVNTSSYSNWRFWVNNYFDHPLSKSQNWYRATLVFESVIDLLTIPVTSAVCIKAALTYSQQRKHRVTARQALLLADHSWTSIPKLFKILWSTQRRSWSKSFTPIFFFALALNCIGFTLAPLKQVLVGHKTIKVPSYHSSTGLSRLNDILELFYYQQPEYSEKLVGIVRDRLATTNSRAPQSHLWYHSCGFVCEKGTDASLLDLQFVTDPFVSQVPAFYHTGFYKQYAPRISSTVDYIVIDGPDLPAECNNSSSSFYREFSNADLSFPLQICMPGNSLDITPWNATRDRQDISEDLFLKVPKNSTRLGPIVKITVKTTVGYFELPNYNNGGKPAPLLQKSPTRKEFRHGGDWHQLEDGFNFAGKSPAELPNPHRLELVLNRGPLLTIALAAFGDGSVLSRQVASNNKDRSLVAGEIAPFGIFNDRLCSIKPEGCMKYFMEKHPLQKEMEAAVFLANEAWLIDSVGRDFGLFYVGSDLGADTIIPTMSLASMIGLSILLCIFLVALFAMAAYAYSYKHWADSLDGFAMMRLGAAAGPMLPLAFGIDVENIEVLDELPCWVGDADPEASVGRLRVGAEGPLVRDRFYSKE